MAGATAPLQGPNPAAVSLHPKNLYDQQTVSCTTDDRTQASRISGHTWNILNHREDHEVYHLDARSREHFIDDTGKATKHWFQKKKRIPLEGGGYVDACQSRNVTKVMAQPQDNGREASQLRARQAKQLLQASAPNNFAAYVARRTSSAAPPTPERASHDRTIPFQDQERDSAPKPKVSPRTLNKQIWATRRGDLRTELRPPPEHEMFKSVDQLRAESHMDVSEQNFAASLRASRSASLGQSGATALSSATTQRSLNIGREDEPPKPAAARKNHSRTRLESNDAREISNWPYYQDKLQRPDPFYVRPAHQLGGSSVKFDIITGERKQFWY
mmetsp:Transcript_47625/g.94690  ORF Transcript_47625/g.94690 Transcript_47625/m.94690 type:complete len:330 (+) Transcript_47625:89-1078(+)